jgi:hypothetical protein
MKKKASRCAAPLWVCARVARPGFDDYRMNEEALSRRASSRLRVVLLNMAPSQRTSCPRLSKDALFAKTPLSTNSERPGFIEGDGIGDEAICLLGGLALLFVAALLDHTLGQHADVADEGDACLHDGFDLGDEGGAALELHGICTGGDEAAGIVEGLTGGVVAVRGQIAQDGGAGGATADGGDVVDHHVHGDAGGVWQAEDDHAEGVADEKEVGAGLIQQSGRWGSRRR